MPKGTWNRYATFRREMLDLLAAERATGSNKYVAAIQAEMAAGRRTHWAGGRQRRYNQGFAS